MTKSIINYWLKTYWTVHGDPRVANYPFMGSLRPVLAVCSLYLVFVLYLGPRFMAKRPPYQLKGLLLVYNTFMCGLNAYFFGHLMWEWRQVVERLYDLKFPDQWVTTEWELNKMWYTYLYMMSKFIDLFDTVLFVLRKKQSQITALHVYHHCSIAFFGWIYLRQHALCNLLLPFVVMNTFIHTLMYAYYGLAAMGPTIQPYLWWKRYVTQLQLGQFVLIFIYGIIFLSFQQGYPHFLVYNALVQAGLYFVLFFRFYIHTYRGANAKATLDVNGNRQNKIA